MRRLLTTLGLCAVLGVVTTLVAAWLCARIAELGHDDIGWVVRDTADCYYDIESGFGLDRARLVCYPSSAEPTGDAARAGGDALPTWMKLPRVERGTTVSLRYVGAGWPFRCFRAHGGVLAHQADRGRTMARRHRDR